jgi:hypothetical protein
VDAAAQSAPKADITALHHARRGIRGQRSIPRDRS